MPDETRTLNVPPSDKIFEQLGHNNYEDVDIVSELIDNALNNRIEDEKLTIEIEVGVSEENPEDSYMIIKDDASGIAFEELGEAISPGGTAGNQDEALSEHGLGMKQAIAAAGQLDHLKTKTENDDLATVIEEFSYNDQEVPAEEVNWDHGTIVKVNNLHSRLRNGWRHYMQSFQSKLGARYRRFLDTDTEMEMKLEWKNLDSEDGSDEHSTWIGPEKPVYFHPQKRQNKPVVLKREFSGDDWRAKLTIGYAPESEEQYEELGLETLKRYSPYNVSLSKQGLDILKNDRVIQFNMLSELGLINTPHPQYNHIRGEIDLVEGFSTAITKNRIEDDERFEELLSKIEQYLDEESILEGRRVPEQLPEDVLRDRLRNHLVNRSIDPKNSAETEYAVQGLGGFIDVLAEEKEAFELKANQAGGLDVYQLLAYLDLGDLSKGYLVAQSFTTGANQAKDYIQDNREKDIKLVSRDEFPINQELSEEELDKYL